MYQWDFNSGLFVHIPWCINAICSSCGTEDTTSATGTDKHSAADPTAGGCEIVTTHICFCAQIQANNEMRKYTLGKVEGTNLV